MITEFRNVYGSAEDPVATWPYEGMVEVLERGGAHSWRPILTEIRREPWGPVARRLEKYLSYAEEQALVNLFSLAISTYRAAAESQEKELVAKRVRTAIEESGLSAHEFASLIGTSPSRLSTYATGKVVPSAAMLMRMEQYAAQDA